MSTPFGPQLIGETEKTLNALLRRLLQGTGLTEPQWVTLRLANLLDETVIYYMSDHGLTLGENGVMGKDGARAQWHIYHVPAMIRHPEGKLAGETSEYFASTHDVSRTRSMVASSMSTWTTHE